MDDSPLRCAHRLEPHGRSVSNGAVGGLPSGRLEPRAAALPVAACVDLDGLAAGALPSIGDRRHDVLDGVDRAALAADDHSDVGRQTP